MIPFKEKNKNAFLSIPPVKSSKQKRLIVSCSCSVKANCPLVKPGPIRGVFLGDPSPYLSSNFGENHG